MLNLSLGLLSLPYSSIVQVRNFLYERGLKKSFGVEVPVVSVGNVSVGGTGKTPTVEFLARHFQSHGLRPCVISRGYGATDGLNDEGRVLEANLPGIAQLQSPDRVAAARWMADRGECDVIVLDDGFQHRRLQRDLDIVLVDATAPFGDGRLLPAGLLREPITALRRAHLVLVSRCDLISENRLSQLRNEIADAAPDAGVAESVHSPIEPLNVDGYRTDLQSLKCRPVAALCGIGNPSAFVATLRQLGAELIDINLFPDHHSYTARDLGRLHHWAASLPPGSQIVTTQKDLVKLKVSELGGRPVWALQIGLKITNGWERMSILLEEIIHAGMQSKFGGSQTGKAGSVAA